MTPIIAHNFGWSSRSAEHRHIGRDITRIGYEAFYTRDYLPLYMMGYRRYLQQNPGGIEPTEDAMSFNQFPEKDRWLGRMRERLSLSADLGSRAYIRAGQRAAELMPGIEITPYLGSITTDPDFAYEHDPSRWQFKVAAALSAPLRAGCKAIGFDASSRITIGSREHRLLQMLVAQGVTPIVEAWPHRWGSHLHDYPVVMVYGKSYATYQSHPDSPKGLLTGERMILLGQPGSIEQAREAVREIVGNGDTPCLWPSLAEWYAREFGI